MATLIDGIEIPHPCSASWAAMDGDTRARFCKLCSKVVHETTALTTCELEKMLDAPVAPCLRVHRDRLGRVLTRDRLAALAFVGLAACTGGVGETGDFFDTADTRDVVTATSAQDQGAGRQRARGARTGPQRALDRGIPELDGQVVPARATPSLGEPAKIDESVVDRIAPERPPPPCMGLPRPVLMGGVSPHMAKRSLPNGSLAKEK